MKGWIVVVIAVICLFAGGIAGALIVGGKAAGVGVAAGLLTGSQAGVCLAVETAKQQGMLAPAAADAVINTTVAKIRRTASPEVASELRWIGNERDCAEIVAKMRNAAQTDTR